MVVVVAVKKEVDRGKRNERVLVTLTMMVDHVFYSALFTRYLQYFNPRSVNDRSRMSRPVVLAQRIHVVFH